MEQQYYSPSQVAEIVGVSVLTVYRWIDKGKLHAVKVGQWRITQADIEDMMRRADQHQQMRNGK